MPKKTTNYQLNLIDMSMMYCHKHDRHFDSDEYTECPECASESEEDVNEEIYGDN